MSWNRFASLLMAVVVVAPFADVNAQAGKAAARDPADAKATVPPVRYESAFARYRPNADVEVGAWRDANDSVGRIGGWRVYGREAIEDPKADRGPAGGTGASGAAAKPEHGRTAGGAR